MYISKIFDDFDKWYLADPHRKNIDYYDKMITKENLTLMTDEKFTDFFKEFSKNGGKIQSGGERQMNRFEEYVIENLQSFRKFILEPFDDSFNLENWFNRIEDHKHFGIGTATIYLNRVDRNVYSVLNNKTLDALKLLDHNISKAKNYSNYQKVKAIQSDWIKREPRFENFYKTDALTHFLIGTENGRKLIERVKTEINIDENYEQEIITGIEKKDFIDQKELLKTIKTIENDNQEYINIKSKQYKRSNYLMALIKKYRGYKCQICEEKILKENGEYYIEACHIKAKADGGGDTLENILILCPNHHKLFDYGKRLILKQDNTECRIKLNDVEYMVNLQ